VSFIATHRDRWGVEPICRVLQVAPSTSDAASSRPPSARALRDAELKVEIARVYKANFEVYGARKVWRQLGREGIAVGRDRVARLMGELGICGVVRGKPRRTTTPDQADQRPADLVERDFSAPAPNRLWVADRTDVATWAGVAYVALVIDACSRMIVGWRVSASLRAELALDALEMAVWARQGDLDGLVHHSDCGVGVPVDPLHRAAGRGRRGGLGWLPRRQLRQRLGGGNQRAVQGGADRPSWPVADRRAGRAGHPGVGRVVEPAPAPRRDRRHPACRTRSHLLP